ncbi:hypothetical protein HaLaN_07988 [Haematococcus lacustris]|uniref:Uncharacterized protein n=1 Tax=Haematococcus lacustris TaxID=44745 RepID=A0A699YXS6_HAELA|nr:hypothetical protein HaLaN_07988 [Haematococcus lacustris]
MPTLKVTLTIDDPAENVELTETWSMAVSKGPDVELTHPNQMERGRNKELCNEALAGLITLHLSRTRPSMTGLEVRAFLEKHGLEYPPAFGVYPTTAKLCYVGA